MAELNLEHFPENLRPKITFLVETITRDDKAPQIADILYALHQKFGEGIITYLKQSLNQSNPLASNPLSFEELEASLKFWSRRIN